ncbi:hypothetical protein, partial [Microcoleus sp. herbarium12]|uniref:hypothetical protein n=1 Tax=Microcoleus sp. herbarium12 TaxID=3055437 RepID=UPI002FD3AFB1
MLNKSNSPGRTGGWPETGIFPIALGRTRHCCFPRADRTFCTNHLALLYNCTGVQQYFGQFWNRDAPRVEPK